MQRLHNKVAVITGGTGGIGLASAKLFAADIGAERAMGVAADVTDPAQVEAYVQATIARHGGLDVFFNNAGIEAAVAPITDYPVEMFDQLMAVNVRGVFLASDESGYITGNSYPIDGGMSAA